MEIINNEFGIAEPDPLDNLEVFIMVGNAQDFLDEHYKETTKPLTRRIGAIIIANLKDIKTYAPILSIFGCRF